MTSCYTYGPTDKQGNVHIVHTNLFRIKSLLAVHVYLLLTQSNYVCSPCRAVPCHSLETHRRSMFRYFQVNLSNNQCVFWLRTHTLSNKHYSLCACACVCNVHAYLWTAYMLYLWNVNRTHSAMGLPLMLLVFA